MGDLPTGATRLKSPGAADKDGGDAALIRQSLAAPECFAELFDRHGPAIHRYVARRLGPDTADDLTGEVFLIAFARRGTYDTACADARPWLYGIATNLVGRSRRDEVRLLRAIARSGGTPAPESFAEQVADRVAAQAIRGRLASALSRLSRGQRDVLLLTANGLSGQEIAVATGVKRGTVASRLARARSQVRAELGDLNIDRTEGD